MFLPQKNDTQAFLPECHQFLSLYSHFKAILAFYLLCAVIILCFCLFIPCRKFGIAFFNQHKTQPSASELLTLNENKSKPVFLPVD